MTATASRLRAPQGPARLLAGVDFGPLPRQVDLVGLLQAAGLRGRGGAGFPTATKLAAVADARGTTVVVANGVEGEPASKKDRSLLRVEPHLVLDGLALAAEAVGAGRVVVGLARPAPELQAALARRKERVPVELAPVPDRFVAGEETALLAAIEGRAAKPTLKPPYPVERGLDRAPTLVQNVETLAHIALIARFGPDWFGGGTALITLGGAVQRPGVHELPLGVSLTEAIARCGGLAAPVRAYLVGGYFGRFVAAGAADEVALTPDVLGAGAIVALPASTCAAAECARVLAYVAGESAGQCGPCVHGLKAIADTLGGDRRGDRRAELARLAGLVEGRGACRHPDGAARLVRSALDVFADEFARHAAHRGCGRRYEAVLPLPARRRR